MCSRSNSSDSKQICCFSHGYAFHTASLLSGDLSKFHELIEDIVAQADEIDETYLQARKK